MRKVSQCGDDSIIVASGLVTWIGIVLYALHSYIGLPYKFVGNVLLVLLRGTKLCLDDTHGAGRPY